MELDISEAVQYHYDKFPPSSIDYQSFIDDILAATEAIARFDQMLKNLHNNEILLAPLRNQEALLSSRMEGTISTMDEILEFEADSEGEQGPEVRSDVIETILYQRTLKNAQEAVEDGYTFSVSFIRQMHQQLLSAGRGAKKTPGKFKTEQNYLADRFKRKILFVPIRPENLEENLQNLIQFINESALPELIKTALMHVEFEALHPFQDGNGRIGRMLITLNLWKASLLSQPHFYISGYFEEHKDEYIETMRNVSAQGDWNTWIQFFLIAVKIQAEKNLEIAEEIRQLYENTKTEFSELLSSKWNLEILDYIFTYPVFRNNKLQKETGIPGATAQSMVKKLVENNYLKVREEASGRRAGLYSFEPLMRLVRV